MSLYMMVWNLEFLLVLSLVFAALRHARELHLRATGCASQTKALG